MKPRNLLEPIEDSGCSPLIKVDAINFNASAWAWLIQDFSFPLPIFNSLVGATVREEFEVAVSDVKERPTSMASTSIIVLAELGRAEAGDELANFVWASASRPLVAKRVATPRDGRADVEGLAEPDCDCPNKRMANSL